MNDSNTDTESTYNMELFVRSLAPSGAKEQQAKIVATMDRLQRKSTIDGYSVVVWGDRICPETARATGLGQSILDKIDQLREWGRDHDISLEPYFERREIRSMLDEPYLAIVPPVMCLAVYEGDELWGVFPCLQADEQCSIVDCLESFEAGEPLHTASEEVGTIGQSTVGPRDHHNVDG